MKIIFHILCLLLLFFSFVSYPQEQKLEFSVLFYNVENLFDTIDDSISGDDEFTPMGDRHWTNKRFNGKIFNISKVILNSSGFYPPDIIGLCEIENRNVLERLIQNSPLKTYFYKIIHKESPDHRGIDVALLYNSNRVYPLDYQFLKLVNDGSVVQTREILYFSGIADQQDTLHFFINHWPSRYGGLLETKQDRTFAARLLRDKVDSLFQQNQNSKIIILGDFNDQPSDVSLKNELKVKEPATIIQENHLYNLSWQWIGKEPGTLKYQLQWSVFDQIIVSGSLLGKNAGLSTKPDYAKIVDLPFLLEKDERYGGVKPKRTYNGFSYNGGFSDHLPVLLKLYSEN
jgi:endonuclease/exonuclease/phosphatase family metal-dependent hydrolase